MKYKDTLFPYSFESEQAVLGCMILDKYIYDKVVGIVNEGDFYNKKHRVIYQAITFLRNSLRPIDIILIYEIVKTYNLEKNFITIYYLYNLIDNISNSVNIFYYINIIKEKTLLRSFIKIGNEIITNSISGHISSCFSIINRIENNLMCIINQHVNNKNNYPLHINYILGRTMNRIESLFSNNSSITGLPTGFYELDRITLGLQPSDLVIIAGRPSMGKSTFALNITEFISVKKNITTVIFSLEMSSEQLSMKIISSISKIKLSKIKNGQLKDSEWSRFASAVYLLSKKIYL